MLDWQTGVIVSAAYGLHSAELRAYQDFLLLATEEEVRAVSAHEFGPPEALLDPVSEALQRILSKESNPFMLKGPRADLRALGPDAWPLLAGQLPRVSSVWIRVIASLLADAGYRPAASVMAKLLREWRGSSSQDVLARSALAEGLGRIGSPQEVGTLLSVLEDRAESPEVMGEALMALAALRAESAVERISKVLAESDRSQRRWTPPSPEAFLALVGAP